MSIAKLYLAGGCFWGVQGYFNQLKGVIRSSVGYIDGNMSHPTYELVCSGIATHAEAIYLEIDLSKVDISFILKHYLMIIDPFSVNRQGNDVGIQYRTGIYSQELSLLEEITLYLKAHFKERYQDIKVEVKLANDYVQAESYHQEYLEKNPNGYCHIDLNSISSEDKK